MDNNNRDFKQLGESFEKFRTAVNQIRAQWNPAMADLHERLRPFREAQARLQEELTPFIESQKQLRKQLAPFREAINKIVTAEFRELSKRVEQLPARTREAMITMAEQGWYVDLEMPMPVIWELQKAIEQSRLEEAEAALTTYFQSRVDEIEEALIAAFPDRSSIISAAMQAHRNEAYELSVPVFLSQADGICYEVARKYYFLKKGGKPQIAEHVESAAVCALQKAMMAPLSQPLPISANENQRGEGFNQLNRHMVLHGESLDYGTRENSLRALSLLNYVAHILSSDEV